MAGKKRKAKGNPVDLMVDHCTKKLEQLHKLEARLTKWGQDKAAGALKEAYDQVKGASAILSALPDDWAPPKSGRGTALAQGAFVQVKKKYVDDYAELLGDGDLTVTRAAGKLVFVETDDGKAVGIPRLHLELVS